MGSIFVASGLISRCLRTNFLLIYDLCLREDSTGRLTLIGNEVPGMIVVQLSLLDLSDYGVVLILKSYMIHRKAVIHASKSSVA